MTILTATDSTMERMENKLSRRLGVTIEDGSQGGDRVGDVLARTERIGRGKQLIIRCGHNVELRRGEIEVILDAIRRIAAIGADYVVLELGMVSDVAPPMTDAAKKLRGYRDEVCRRLAAEHGDRYVPIHQMLLAEADKLPGLSAEDERWIANGMLPRQWWALPPATNGHTSESCKEVAADVLAPVLRWRFLGGPKPGGATPVDHPVDPPVPVDPPPLPMDPPPPSGSTLRDLIRALRRKLRRRP